MKTKCSEKKTYDISTLSRLMKKDFIFVIAVFLALVLIFTDISIYETFGSVRSRKLEAENLAVICVSEIERNSEDGQLSFLSENVNLSALTTRGYIYSIYKQKIIRMFMKQFMGLILNDSINQFVFVLIFLKKTFILQLHLMATG